MKPTMWEGEHSKVIIIVPDDFVRKESDSFSFLLVNAFCENEFGPNVMYYFDDGWSIHLWLNGNRKHRTTGPAYISYHPDGSIDLKHYYINDENLSEDQFKEMQENISILK